jgi:hypothetical protein
VLEIWVGDELVPVALARPDHLRLCRCSPEDLRAAVVADVLRRTAGVLRLRTQLTAPDEDLLAWNVHPPTTVLVGHPDADVHVSAHNGSATVAVGPWSAPEGADPLTVRLAMLRRPPGVAAHLTEEDLAAASTLLGRWRAAVAAWAEEPSKPMCAEVQANLLSALTAGPDTGRAIDVLVELERTTALPPGCRFETFVWADRLLGLDLAAGAGR